jgi:hypothetical protein
MGSRDNLSGNPSYRVDRSDSVAGPSSSRKHSRPLSPRDAPARQSDGHVAASTAPHLLDVAEAHCVVLESLPFDSLASVACCCRQLRELVEQSASGADRWRSLVQSELGRSSAALHARYLHPRHDLCNGATLELSFRYRGSPANESDLTTAPPSFAAQFWRKLFRSLYIGGELHWGRSAATRLWSQVRCVAYLSCVVQFFLSQVSASSMLHCRPLASTARSSSLRQSVYRRSVFPGGLFFSTLHAQRSSTVLHV